MDHLKVNRKKKKEREVSRHHKEIDYLVLALKKRERHTTHIGTYKQIRNVSTVHSQCVMQT